MTTKKTDDKGEKVVKRTRRKKNVDVDPTTTTTGYCRPEYIDTNNMKGEVKVTESDNDEPKTYKFYWGDRDDDKLDLAKEILIRLIDFNLEQLSRQDVDKVLIYDNPAEYAAEVVNELYERTGK